MLRSVQGRCVLMAMDELGATERVSLSDGVKGGKWEGWGKKFVDEQPQKWGSLRWLILAWGW